MMTTNEKPSCAIEGCESARLSFDPAALADLVKRVIGGQKITDFTREAGISTSFVSKALNQRLSGAPTRRIIIRLYEKSADATVTLNELLIAAGLEPDTPKATSTNPRNIVNTYLGQGSLLPLTLFLHTKGIGNHDVFTIRYERHRFIVETAVGDKNMVYICYPAMSYGNRDAMKLIVGETSINLMKEERDDIQGKANISMSILTDEPFIANYFKTFTNNMMSGRLDEPVEVLLTQDNISASSY